VPRDPEEAARARRIRDLGIIQSRTERAQAIGYAVEGFGLRAHLPATNAAIGRAQLARFPVVSGRRKELWSAYQAELDGIDGVSVIDVDIARSVPFNCVVRIDEERARNRRGRPLPAQPRPARIRRLAPPAAADRACGPAGTKPAIPPGPHQPGRQPRDRSAA
jgi:dTDP-4-amino-4,6-dideoxygalactose transaminase